MISPRLKRASLFNMKRISFYIDGYNFYRGLRDKKWERFYWLDIVKFCSMFLRANQELIEVNYFSAIPKNPGKQERFDRFLSANRLNAKFSLHLGKFLEKTLVVKGETIKTYEEKQTDVHIAVKMIRDVILQRCDGSILISADSDLTPAIDFIREYKSDHKIFVYFPPNRFSYDLKQRADAFLHLQNYIRKFEGSLLPEQIILPNGYILTRPTKWN
jgi:uncharacterized LabA/DUF88 family protein